MIVTNVFAMWSPSIHILIHFSFKSFNKLIICFGISKKSLQKIPNLRYNPCKPVPGPCHEIHYKAHTYHNPRYKDIQYEYTFSVLLLWNYLSPVHCSFPTPLFDDLTLFFCCVFDQNRSHCLHLLRITLKGKDLSLTFLTVFAIARTEQTFYD